MARCTVPEADEVLDREYGVLDKGFVRLVDYLGGDARVVQAARVSYGDGTKTVREDAALIDYLLRHEHTSPFEQVVLVFHVKMPIFVARQWIRHRTARVNEISGRYSVMRDECYVPALGGVAPQSADNKQGREAEPFDEATAERVRFALADGQRRAYADYSALLDTGVARELARINLPLSLYTEWYWQMDLHNLFRFLKLRLDPHAQKEIRDYSAVILDIARKVAPLCCASFERVALRAVSFDGDEVEELRRRLAAGGQAEPTGPAIAAEDAASMKGRLSGKALERFEEKLRSGRQL